MHEIKKINTASEDRRAHLIDELRPLIPKAATIGRHGTKILIKFEAEYSFLDAGEATEYARWLSSGKSGTFRDMVRPPRPGSTQAMTETIARMHTALAKIRAMAVEVTGAKDVHGRFIHNAFAERIGKIAGEAMTGLAGGD